MPTTVYRADVTREGRWWAIHIPELDLFTQGRWRGEVNAMARDVIACTLDVDPSDVSVDIHFLETDGGSSIR